MAKTQKRRKHAPVPPSFLRASIDTTLPAAEYIPITELDPWDANPRDNDDAVEDVARSIAELGWGAPMVARRTDDGRYQILAGHTRWKAAQLLGLEVVPVRVIELDDAKATVLALADNKLGEKATWKDDDLAELLGSISRDDAHLAGWTDKELDALLKSIETDEQRAEDDEDEKPEDLPEIAKEGDLWVLGDHRLLCGDSTKDEDVDRVLGGEYADLVCTDPPFAIYGSSTGIGADIADDKMVRPFFERVLKQLARVVPDFGHIYVFCDWRSWGAIWDSAKRAQLSPKNLLVWDKGNGGLGGMYANCHELVGFFAKLPPPKSMKSGKEAGERCVFAPNILRYARASGEERNHNASKPVELVRELIRNSSDKGAVVLDLFNGGGTTLIACEREGRRYRGLDIEPREVDKTIRRWEKLTGGRAERVGE